MKKLFISMILVMGLMILPMTAGATSFTLTQAEIAGMTQVYDNPTGNATLNSAMPYGGGIAFSSSQGLTSQYGFNQSQIGYEFNANPYNPDPVTGWMTLDLSSYTTFDLQFYNNNGHKYMINLSLNTGWIPGEGDTYRENGWTWISPGETKNLSVSLTGMLNLSHVTYIGFNAGTNYYDPQNESPNGDEAYWTNYGHGLDVVVSPVPEPATMLLLGVGLIGLAGMGRKKFSKK